ncbi:MAG TPA: hypothetical protein VHI11_09800 [Jiangellaceae bacterium]|jgi:hypothetical protein|nr:hypothetical protein [Jiangellaceae bacterium]
MDGHAPQDDGDPTEDRYRALVALHALSPDYGMYRERLPGPYQGRDIGADLRLVTEAPDDEIPVSARLAVLYDLAKAGYPGSDDYAAAYPALAESAVQRRIRPDQPVDANELLADIKGAAEAGEPLSTRDTARAFAHSEVAFIGRPVCDIQRVVVGGIPATWLYSEFETDAAFASVATWLDPRRWPTLGPMLFKRMDLVFPAEPLALTAPPAGQPHWRGTFREEVQLVRRLSTLLSCTYWRNDGGGTAATTYDLDHSLDNEIDVDRGYLLVTDTGGVRRVQVLKIVGFTEDLWDSLAVFVCPFWTDWIRGALRDATTSTPTSHTHTPGTAQSPLGQTVEDWIEYFGEAVQPYLDLCNDASTRMRSGSYTSAEVLADGSRWWSQFAKDWAGAWTNWSNTVEEVAKEGMDAGLTPPGTPTERGRGTVKALATPAAAKPGGTAVRVAGLGAAERPECSELVSIDRGAPRIPPSDVEVTVEEAEGTRLVRLRTTNTSAPHGLYVGRLRTPANQELAPVQLYVSRATRA